MAKALLNARAFSLDWALAGNSDWNTGYWHLDTGY
jgi:hypothetical protein